MPWPDEFSFDPYAAGAPDPFGPQPPPDQFAMPQSWRDIVANAPDQPPSVPMPDPLGLPPAALEGVGAALPPPAPPPEIQFGAPREVTGAMPEDERTALGLPPYASPPSDVAPPSFFGAPLPQPIAQVDLAHGIVDQGIGNAPPEPEIEMPAVYENPLEDPTLDDAGRAGALVDLAGEDPARYARLKAMQERAEDVEFKTRELEAKERNYEAAEENARIRRQAVEDAQREIDEVRVARKELAERKVDNDAWFKSRTVPQKISAVLMGVIGGLIQGRVGGRNTGLDMVLKMADDHVETQKFNLQQQRADLAQREQAAGQKRAGADDIYRAGETLRMATLERVANQIATERGQYDPRGKAAIALADMEMGIRSAIGKADQDYQEKALDRGIKLGTYNLALRKQGEEERKHRADEAAKAAKATGAGTGLLTPAQIKQDFGVDVGRPMSQKDVNAFLEGKGKAQDLKANAPATGRSKEQLERTVPGLKMADGSDFIATAGDVAEIKKLRGALPETKNVVRVMDEMIRLIDENGQEVDFLKSKGWQQAKANWADAVLTTKGENMYGLGVLAGPDVEIIGQAIGTSDPTQLRDTTEGIKQGRRNIIAKLQGKAESLGYPGSVDPLFPFLDPSRKPKDNPEDKAFKAAQSKVRLRDMGGDDRDRVAVEERRVGPESSTIPIESAMPSSVQKGLDQIEHIASQNPKYFGREPDDALTLLDKLGDEKGKDRGGNKAIRQWARDAAERVRQEQTRRLDESAAEPDVSRTSNEAARAEALQQQRPAKRRERSVDAKGYR